jgi:hypothetical protein
MKKIVFILTLAFGFASNCHAQTWTYIQDSIDTGCPTGSTCNYDTSVGLLPTTAGTVWVVQVQTFGTNVTISSVCSTGSGCSGSDSGWTLCPASSCHLFSSSPSRNVDMAYSLTGPAGTTNVKVTLSSSAGSSPMGVTFFEFLPPAGATASFDNAGTTSSATCSGTCAGVPLTISGTDVILQSLHANNTPVWNAWSAPSLTLPLGEGLNLNATSGAAPTAIVDSTGDVTDAIAFTSTAGSFNSPPAGPISVVNYKNFDSANAPNCTPSCSITIPSTGTGHLLYLEAATITSSFISSVSGGGTWVVPTGANSCRAPLSGGFAISCAYVLSSTAGATSLNITMTGSQSTPMAVWELATTGGSFSFDTQGSATNAASYSPFGVALSLSGSNDAIFQSIFVPGGTSTVSLYPYPRNNGCGIQFYCGQAANALRINTTDGTAPRWANQQNNATVVTGVAFKTGTGTVVAPPTGLAAVVN